MAGRLSNKVTLITGGVMGIGRAHSLLFAKEGATVIITTRGKVKQGETLANEIIEANGNALFYKLDVNSETDWKNVVDDVIQQHGKLNILVNNAGISLAKNIEQTTLKEWNDILAINATGVFLGAKYAITIGLYSAATTLYQYGLRHTSNVDFIDNVMHPKKALKDIYNSATQGVSDCFSSLKQLPTQHSEI